MIILLVRRQLTSPVALPFSLSAAALLALSPPLVATLLALPLLMSAAPIMGQRPTLFEAALPIPTRRVYAARLVSTVLLIWFPVAVALIAVVVRGDRNTQLLTWLGAGGVATLAALLPPAIDAAQIRQPSPLKLLGAFAGLAAMVALSMKLLPNGLTVTLVFLTIAMVVAHTVRALPPSYQTAARSAANPGAAHGRRTWTDRLSPDWWWWPAFQSTFHGMLFFIFGLSMLNGVTSSVLVYFLIFGVTLIDSTRQRTRWLEALPLSNRARLLFALVPVLLAMPGGLFVGSHLPPRHAIDDYIQHHSPYLPGTRSQYPSNTTNVALEYWRVTPGAKVPLITAPWGEQYRADTLSVLGILFHNPYTTGKTSSKAFIEWQFSRATTAIYGEPMTLEQYQSHPHKLGERVTNSGRMQILNGAAVLLLVLLMAFVYELSSWRGFVTWRRGTAIAMLLRLVPLYLPLAYDMAFEFRRGTTIIVPLTESFLLELAQRLPQNILLLAAAAAIPVVALYLLVERQFAKSELSRALKMAV